MFLCMCVDVKNCNLISAANRILSNKAIQPNILKYRMCLKIVYV